MASALITQLRKMAEDGEIDESKLPKLIFALQIDTMEEVQKIGEKVETHSHGDYVTKDQHSLLNDEVKAWKNRAIGVGIAATFLGGAGGAALASFLTKLPGP